MDDADITLIQESFAKVVPIRDTAAGIFYDQIQRVVLSIGVVS